MKNDKQLDYLKVLLLGQLTKKEMSYKSAKKIGLQTDFFFGTGSGCQAGFCTD